MMAGAQRQRMAVLWAPILLIALGVPARAGITVSTDRGGRIEFTHGGRPMATLVTELAGPDWEAFAFEPEGKDRVVSDQERELTVKFRTWSALQPACVRSLVHFEAIDRCYSKRLRSRSSSKARPRPSSKPSTLTDQLR